MSALDPLEIRKGQGQPGDSRLIIDQGEDQFQGGFAATEPLIQERMEPGESENWALELAPSEASGPELCVDELSGASLSASDLPVLVGSAPLRRRFIAGVLDGLTLLASAGIADADVHHTPFRIAAPGGRIKRHLAERMNR